MEIDKNKSWMVYKRSNVFVDLCDGEDVLCNLFIFLIDLY